jgi:Sulfatase
LRPGFPIDFPAFPFGWTIPATHADVAQPAHPGCAFLGSPGQRVVQPPPSCYGGLIDTPNIDRVAAAGLRYTQWHTTALCSPTRSCLLTGRNHTTNGMACITEAASGFPTAPT